MSRQAKLGVIGAGWWATTAHLPSMVLNPQVDLVAVCDPSPVRAQAAAQNFGVPHSYTDVHAMLEAGGLDGVVVATPHTTHYDIVAAALHAGVGVLVEKPMATTAEHAWALVQIAAQTDTMLSVGLTYQYAPAARRVRTAVREEIGELVCVNAEFSSNTFSLFATTDPAKANLDDPARPHGTTYSDPALSGGGQGQTQLTHILGGLLWAAGDQATEVSAFMDNRSLAVDVVDALAFRLAGGALCTTSSTGTTPPGAPVRHRIRFHGTTGVVEWDLLKADAWIYREGGIIEHVEHPVNRPSYAAREVSAAFAALVLGDGPNLAPADYAAASAALIEASYHAASSKRAEPVMQGPLTSV